MVWVGDVEMDVAVSPDITELESCENTEERLLGLTGRAIGGCFDMVVFSDEPLLMYPNWFLTPT